MDEKDDLEPLQIGDVGGAIDSQVADTSDVEMLQDLVCAGVNEALRKAQALETEEMKRLTGGLGLPFDLTGLFGR